MSRVNIYNCCMMKLNLQFRKLTYFEFKVRILFPDEVIRRFFGQTQSHHPVSENTKK